MDYINHQGDPSHRLSELAIAICAEAIAMGFQYSRLVQNSGQTQLDVASSNFSLYRYSVRQAYNRPVCELPAPKVQQSILATSF
ncbi:hypothetical protein DPMN_191793 [Dreissena polymorpha]|uniref:Uncharacterized protein n=1 Tax=Dreissena polymorpha TaxID=45954 RepID=A0A9D3Y137_DREPO|nr:hypothetical protein DPMN_191793 [Dreissena polymorpha]